MDLSIRTETFGQDDQSWLGSAHGTNSARTITLDTSTFTEGTHYPDGYFKSGIPLGKITASGKYGPYAGRTSEIQTITISATGGTFTATFEGATTAAVAWDASAATFKTALEALATIQPGDITVTKAGDVFTVTFVGKFAGENVTVMTTNAGSLTGGAGTAVVATGTAGGAAATDGTEIFAGFLFCAVKAPTLTTTDVGAAMLDHCRVVESKLPIAVDAAGKRDVAGRIIFA
jgi:hypothetical protein